MIPKATKRIPTEYKNLPSKQKEKLRAYCEDVAMEAAKEQLYEDMKPVLESYIKMVCIVLHDAFGFGEKRLRMFIGNHRRLFAKQYKLVANGEQLPYLNKRMEEIFHKDGFPQDFLDDLIGKVEVVDV